MVDVCFVIRRRHSTRMSLRSNKRLAGNVVKKLPAIPSLIFRQYLLFSGFGKRLSGIDTRVVRQMAVWTSPTWGSSPADVGGRTGDVPGTVQ